MISNSEFMQDGKCQVDKSDPEIFFPRTGAGVVAAKAICKDCVVVSECLAYALDNQIDHGIWGGKSERERRKLLQDRRRVKSDLG